MDFVKFPQSNVKFHRPENLSDGQCGAIHSFMGQYNDPFGEMDNLPVVITCWQPSQKDIDRINRGEPLWLHVIGKGMPPVSIQTENPFDEGWLK